MIIPPSMGTPVAAPCRLPPAQEADHEALLAVAAAPHGAPTLLLRRSSRLLRLHQMCKQPCVRHPARHRPDRGGARQRPATDGIPAGRRGPIPTAAAARARALPHRAVPGACRDRGDIVDCGYGATATLAAIGSAFACCRDTSRRLVLFDPSASPAASGGDRNGIVGNRARSHGRHAGLVTPRCSGSGGSIRCDRSSRNTRASSLHVSDRSTVPKPYRRHNLRPEAPPARFPPP
jgi:hypothetical protein